MKIAFVVQRYGLEVCGGAEYLCRLLAEKLSSYYDINILTTCANDSVEWSNYYNEGEELINGVKVRRFSVKKERNVSKFNKFSDFIFNRVHDKNDELRWLEMQGPYCPNLIEFIDNNNKEYDLFIFFTYLYYPTYFGLAKVREKSILVSTAHDEKAIYLSIFNDLFSSAKHIIFLTEEERDFVHRRFNKNFNASVIGCGINSFKLSSSESSDYILFIGRITEGKNCHKLLNYFIKCNPRIKLVLAGEKNMSLPKNDRIVYKGFISEEEKFKLISNCLFLVNPSEYESFSFVVIEAFSCKKPILVYAKCEVLKQHCIKSNGGLYYENFDEFEEAFNILVDNKKLRSELGNNGYKYFNKYYNWGIIINSYKEVIDNFNKEVKENKSLL